MPGKIKRSFAVPPEVLEICRELVHAGEKAYVVGGVLRDMLAGREAGDFDIATTAEPQKVMGLFRRVVPTGVKHGTVTVLMGSSGYEVTTLRGEGAYSDGRHPDSVEFLSEIADDLARRDFTVNAMAWDPSTGEFHDPFHGEEDIAKRLIRAVGDPLERFAEDALRVLRAARFAATLGFEIGRPTMEAMSKAAPGLASVSVERKRDELTKMLLAQKPSVGLEVIERSGILPFVNEDLAALVNMAPLQGRGLGPWKHAVLRVDEVRGTIQSRLAALLFDVCELSSTADIECREFSTAREWTRNMRFERRVVESVTQLLQTARFNLDAHLSEADVRRFVRKAGREDVFDVIELRRADLNGRVDPDAAGRSLDELEKRVRLVVESGVPLFAKELATNGQDLMDELSMEPGPEIGRLLDALVEFVIDDPRNNTREKLLERVKELMK